MDDDPVERRPDVRFSFANERTFLAWNRTGLAVVVFIAVILRPLWPLDATDHVVALACMSAGAAAWAVALFMGRTVSHRALPGVTDRDPRLTAHLRVRFRHPSLHCPRSRRALLSRRLWRFRSQFRFAQR
ncbi:MAG TPA: DUF202 domain-containing protein [Acidimicrobiales bacterium]|nr:DUF202 domain-containing protein [Acidimicrobiales bacterium]